jgi:hypothetical protein
METRAPERVDTEPRSEELGGHDDDSGAASELSGAAVFVCGRESEGETEGLGLREAWGGT